MRRSSIALIGQFERCSARAGNQHLTRACFGCNGSLDRQQRRPTIPRDRPAMTQSIAGAGYAP
jgi:hypothetical protein